MRRNMTLLDDIKAKAEWLYGSRSPRKIIRAVVSDGSFCMFNYRLMSFCSKCRLLKPIAILLCKVNSVLFSAVIGTNASFGKGFVILHCVGIVINTRVTGGENILLESGVVIGETKRGCPVLGSNIFIGSGAKIVGNITIGNNVTIGANAVVVKSIPDNVVVGGVPAKILRTKGPAEDFLLG